MAYTHEGWTNELKKIIANVCGIIDKPPDI